MEAIVAIARLRTGHNGTAACLLFSVLPLIGFAIGATAETQVAASPWRLHDALRLPDWFTLSIEQRTRYENIDNQFRKDANGGDQVVAFRTLVLAEATSAGWRVGAEFIDARITADDAGTPVDNTVINETELLQAYLAWETRDIVGTGLVFNAKLGRQTLDLGNRRLVARNAFRNTINSFTGVDLQLTASNDWQLRTFFFLPDFRLPSETDQLRAERSVLDREDPNNYFWGVFGRKSQLPWNTQGELYVFGLHENDEPNLATRDRRLYTPGLRWFKDPAPGQIDLEIEAAYQVGTSRASTKSTDTSTLDHAAHFEHAQVGYTFGLPWDPRFVAQYDYASGDNNPNDHSNNRFDTLFGARRFEFGPTGIWGAFARSNINSPGYRLIVKPQSTVSAMIGHRLYWLASSRDAWTTTPVTASGTLQDPTGRSGSFVGHQFEASVSWAVLPKNLTVEAGWAHLSKGDFAKNAPGAPRDHGDTDYFYAQTIVQF
jgi:hypothetical protein